MEVKIGVVDTPRELLISSSQSPDEVEALVTEAMRNSQGLLALVDEKGRRFVIPSARVAYVEIAPADVRRVGFAVGGD
ncbi:MAG TPA: DUF3107 domain-containing protein [Pseudonocardiaceae bacterium]